MNFFLRYLASGFAAVLMTICVSTALGQGEQVSRNISTAGDSGTSQTAASEPAPRPVTSTSSLLTRVGVQSAEPVSLTLDEAIRRALSNNNDIEVTRDDVRFQETQIKSIRGIYDPVFTVNPNYNRSSSTGRSATNDFFINADAGGFIRPGGGDYQFFFNNSSTENSFSQQQVSSGSLTGGTGALYSSSLGFRYNQPLMRNFGIDGTRRNLKIARRRLEQTDADFRRTTIDTIARVQNAYWDLVFALRDQQNRVANLDLSKENLRQVEARIAAGSAAPLARAEVATELATREGELLLATEQVSIAENALKQLILRDVTAVEWTQSYVPTDKPVFNLDPVNLDGAIKDALENRFELRRLKLENDVNNIDIAYFRNQTKPRIDLNTSFSFNGLAQGGADTNPFFLPQFSGNEEILRQRLNLLLPANQQIPNPNIEFPGTPSYLAGGFNRSISNLFRSDARNYSVGVTFSFPFRNRTAEANLAGARINQSRIASQTRIREQEVIVEVRNAVQKVETARQRVLTSRRARENAEIQLEGERRLFESGKSTSFILFQRENSLTRARNDEVRAETDYNKALADLQRATSTTFQINNIDVQSPIEK